MLSFLTDEDLATLEKDGKLTFIHKGEFEPNYIPDCENRDTILQELKTKDFNLGIEALFLIKDVDVSKLEILNTLSAVETLQGIEYWSASREKYRTLFVESWTINNLDSKKRVMSPKFKALPDYYEQYIHQKDKTFGNSESKVEYNIKDDSVRMSIINETTLTYTIIPVISKRMMDIELVLIPVENGILYYSFAASKTPELEVVQKKASNSLYNRVIALSDWFKDQL